MLRILITKALSIIIGGVLVLEGLVYVNASSSNAFHIAGLSSFVTKYHNFRDQLVHGTTDLYFFKIENWLFYLLLAALACIALVVLFRKSAKLIEKLRSKLIGTKFDLNSYRFDFEPFDAEPIIKKEQHDHFKNGFRTLMGKTPKDQPKTFVERFKSRFDEKTTPFFISDHMRSMHMLILGQTGCGKSTLMQSMMYQDMICPDGRGIIVIDGKGESSDRDAFFGLAKKAGRLDDAKCIDMGDFHASWFYNPLYVPEGMDPVIVAEKIYSIFKCSEEFYFNFQKSIFIPFFLLLHNVLKQFTFKELYNAFENTEYRSSLMARCSDTELVDSIKRKKLKLSRDFDKSLAGIEAWLSNYKSIPQLNHDVEQNQHFMIDMAKELEQGGLIYVRLPFASYPERCRDVGMLFLQEIQYLLGIRQMNNTNARPFAIYADEFGKYVHENVALALSTSRSANIMWTISTQIASDIDKVAKDFIEQIWSNTRLKFVYSQDDPNIIERISKDIGTHQQVLRTERVSKTFLGTNWSMGETSTRVTDSFRFHPNLIKNLNYFGQGYCISKLFKHKDGGVGVNVGRLDIEPVSHRPNMQFTKPTNMKGTFYENSNNQSIPV
jgi:energy-coupling factor transporter ATP-binding protein EcfA2